MPDSADGHHHRFKVLDLARMQKRPNHDRTCLHEMRSEGLQTVPNSRDREARAKSPRAVAARKHHDGNVNECLEEVEKPKLGDNNRRYC